MPRRRTWTPDQKRAIVEEYVAAPWGTKGSVLRRHQVTSGAVADWATRRDHGRLDVARSGGVLRQLTSQAENAEIVRLRSEVRRLEAERDQARKDREVAEAAVEVLGKASALLQQALRSAEPIQPSDPS